MGQYGFDVPFEWTYLTADAFNSYISVGYGGSSVGVNGLSSMQDFYYLYTGDYEHDMVCMVDLPDDWRGTVINGNVYFAFSTKNGGGEAQFYQSDGVGWTPSGNDVVVDFSQRVDVSLGDCSSFPDSLTAMVYPNQVTDNMYQVQVNFENYYVPYYSPTTSTRVIIPLNFHYTFTTALASESFSSYGSSTQPFSCVLYQFRPTFPPFEFSFGFEPAKFILDNEYYTIAQALANNTALSKIYLNSIDIENYLHDVKTLLSNWLNVGQVDYIDFPDFSQALLGALGSIAQNTSDDYTQDFSQILSYLANIYARQQQILTGVNTASSYASSISSYMSMLYSWATDYSSLHYINDDIGYDNTETLYNVIWGLTYAVTGEPMLTYYDNPPDLAVSTFNRWVQIIREAIGDSLTDASLRLDVAKVSSEETAYHDIEVSVWDDIFDVLDSHPGYLTFWEAYMDAPSAIQGAGVWYVGQIEDLWERIGWITYIISTILIAGVLVLFLGKINQFK